MAVEIEVIYEGNLQCKATHGPSRASLTTDAPTDNGGNGSAFSPTDLVATALGSCMLTIMGLVAKRHNLDISGARVRVIKEMIQQPVRRIGTLKVVIDVANGDKLADNHRKLLMNAALTCPVHKSLHPEIETPIEFRFN